MVEEKPENPWEEWEGDLLEEYNNSGLEIGDELICNDDIYINGYGELLHKNNKIK